MTFAHPLMLLPALVPFLWLALTWSRTSSRLALILKACSLSAVLLALAEPAVTLPKTKTATAVLVDTSGSISDADLTRASSLVSEMNRAKGGNWLKVVPFDSRTRPMSSRELLNGVHFERTSNTSGNATDLENALLSSMSAMPADHLPRLALISDGNENEGSTARAIAELQRLRVPVDTFPLSGQPQSGIKLQSLSLPQEAYAGEQIPIELNVAAPSETHASVELFAEGKSLGTQPGCSQFRRDSGSGSCAGELYRSHHHFRPSHG